MSYARVLSSAGLIRTSRRRGFCPACRLFQSGDDPRELSAPALVCVAFLVVAVAAWTVAVARMSSMEDMSMGLGSIGQFGIAWTIMMTAMMVPSAMPLLFEFARITEGRRRWRVATGLLAVTYLGVWLVFGLACYLVYNALGMPWPNQPLVGGAALVLAGLYALTPLKRASEARCRELCALHVALPFGLMRSAVVAGGRYSLSCMGCSAGLMLAMVLIGVSSLVWMIALTAVLLVYKLAPTPGRRGWLLLASLVVGLGGVYAGTTMMV